MSRVSKGRSPDRTTHALGQIEPLNTRQFVVAIRRLADDLCYGLDNSRYRGSGIDYSQSRLYQPGDPIKSIDWRVTARTAKVFVKEYEAQRRVPAWVLIDTSASMAVSSTRRSKYELALHIGGGLALACQARVSPVGVIGIGERELRVEPTLLQDRVMQWMLKLRRYSFTESTTLEQRVRELRPTLGCRSLVLVVSDLHEPDGVQALSLLAQQHEVAVVQVQDPAELTLRGAGFLRAQEAETGLMLLTHGRRRMLDALRAERQLRRGGVDHIVVRTDQPFVHRLRQFFKARTATVGAR